MYNVQFLVIQFSRDNIYFSLFLRYVEDILNLRTKNQNGYFNELSFLYYIFCYLISYIYQLYVSKSIFTHNGKWSSKMKIMNHIDKIKIKKNIVINMLQCICYIINNV